MAKISHHLLRSEIKSWGTIKRMFSRQTKSFGQYMNQKYHMTDSDLAATESSVGAIRLLLLRHVIQ